MLTVEALKAAYSAAQVLFDVSFAVGEGEMVTLLGRNGMGKTTTISTVMGLIPAAGGRITFDGAALNDWPPPASPGLPSKRRHARRVHKVSMCFPRRPILLDTRRYWWLQTRINASCRC